MSEVVSGLLAKIERLERAANEAMSGSGRWVGGPRRNHPGYEVAELRSGWVHTQTARGLSAHIAANDPESVLRLCRAHRDLVKAYIAARDNPDRRTDAALHLAFNLLRQVVETIARGLGVAEENRNGE